MQKTTTVRPQKTREMHNAAMDSTRWNDFTFRDGDVVIGTWGKSGTTWTQQIVAQLIFAGAEDVPTVDIAPKGTNNRWRNTLSLDEIEKYENTAAANLTPECARWLATGSLGEPS